MAKKSRSARHRPHDWQELTLVVVAAGHEISSGPTIVDWDERYVHAIQQALEGRDNNALLKMLDEGKWLHPALLGAIADVIRAQADSARGRPKSMTYAQSRTIRDVFDRVKAYPPAGGQSVSTLHAELAEMFHTNVSAIVRALQASKRPAK